ncbi:B-cell lymphoma/leukemia 11A-like [Huso huso]|uniref:B-cell lymphoma/leukemia 11A-like n=1 Tax=Huso huso TaxID=61971 RepID=A0ABR0YEA6_HUSHU
MSRRKLGSRPQHVSTFPCETELMEVTLPSLEKVGVLLGEDPSDRDLLTCGQCRHSFPLAHILVFIEHKKGKCQGGACLKETELLGHSPPSPPNRTLSRSAMEPVVQVASRMCEWSRPRENGISVKQENSVEDEGEPSCYICQSCKELFPSAWFLLQHAQSTHGLSIYLEADPLKGCPPRDRESGSLNSLREKIHQRRLVSLQKTDYFSPSFTPPPRWSLPHQINYLYPEMHPEMQPYPQSGNGLSDRFDSPGQDQALNFSARLRELAGNIVSAEPPSPVRGGSPFLQTAQPPREGTPPAGGRAKSCEFCGKTFKSLSNLVVHRRSHTGEKPYRCPFCDHACTQSSKLKRHMKTHRLEIEPQAWESCLGAASALKARAKEYEGYQGADETKPDTAKKSHESEGQEFVLQAEVSEKLPEKKNHWPGSSLYACVPARMRKRKGLYPSLEEQEAEDLAARQLPSDTDLQELANKSLLSSLALSQASPGKQGLLSFLNRRIKLEQREETSGIPPLPPVYQNSLYSQWLSGYNGSINSISDPKDPTPSPTLDSRRASPFGNASERSLENSPENNGDSRVLTEDSSEEALSSESGIASGNCTPSRRRGGRGSVGGYPRSSGGKRFKNSSNLTVHRRSHTGERPYHCTLCSYACAQSSKLTRHMKTHAPHGGKAAFTCQVCHVPFSVYSTLEKHMKKRHANEEAATDSSGTAPCEIRQEQQHSQC